jgi:ribosomal protein S18 acetylase RimI-like enzyme
MTVQPEESLIVRAAREDDVQIIYEMLRESAAAQGDENALCVDRDNLLQDGFRASPPKYWCLLAEAGGRPAGLALYFFIYSTWTSRQQLYLEDLYVSPHFRRRGVARLLMSELARIASAAGCLRIRWLVLRENAAAIEFYESIGAGLRPDWLNMSLERECLEPLWHSATPQM